MVEKSRTRSGLTTKKTTRPTTSPVGPTPVEVIDRDDPGDETQRNFRYQHAYGVILLIASITGQKPYVAIWCEQHEDFLGERADGLYDAYQIKTGKPELGEWELQDDPFRDSIKRFVTLNRKFPGRVRAFYFVSNVKYSASKAVGKVGKSPIRFLEAVRGATFNDGKSWLPSHFQASFEKLREHCGCSGAELVDVLTKLELVEGPGRDSFNDEVAHSHLPAVRGCDLHPPAVLNAIRDELVYTVYKASSLQVEDSSRHWCCIDRDDSLNPLVLAKRIAVVSARTVIEERHPVPLRFTPDTTKHELNSTPEHVSKLEKKMVRGGLGDQVETMRNRAFAAERRLMEVATLRPSEFDGIADQLTAVIKGECDEARLFASSATAPWGPQMLREVFQRLKHISEKRPEMVGRETYEFLVGIAGLLTGDCAVWWSDPFDLEEAA